MKKMLLMLSVVFSMIAITACSNGDSPINEDEQGTEQLQSIVGTWENGNYFVSFGDDGFYSAYIADEFIDSGDYKQTDDEVTCSNIYFNRKTIYTINDLSEVEMDVEVKYIDLYGKQQSKKMTFTKSDNEVASKSNTLAGKSMTTQSSYFGTITRSFTSYNSGVKSASKGSAANYPLSFFYIYIGNTLYHQILDNNSIQVPTIGGWNTDYNEVKCWKLTIAPNGSIDSFENIEL